jgi:ATP-dependent Clp protease ATP-binding subunit ClpC
MFERYTEAARRAIHLAVYFARQVGNTEIETEHLLLGVLKSDMTLANRFLGSPWAGETVWKKIEQKKTIGQKVPGARDMPLDKASKRALVLASEEADLVSSKRIGTEHLLLGLLREEESLAAEILSELGVRLASTRQELSRMPNDDSKTEKFMRERTQVREDVAELQARVKSIRARLEEAISNHEFDKAGVASEEERVEHDKLVLLCRRYGLLDWIYD